MAGITQTNVLNNKMFSSDSFNQRV